MAPYIQNEKSTGLDVLTALAPGDLIIVGDVSDSGRAKAITETDLETTMGIPVIEADILALQGDVTVLQGDVVNLQNQINNINTGGGGFGSFDGKIKSYSLEGLEGIPMLQGYQDVECYLTALGTVINAEFIQDFLQVRDVTLDWADADQINGYVVLNGFLYLLLRDNSAPAYRVYRYNVTDLSLGGTIIAFVTQALGTTDEMVMTSDGTDILFNYDAGNSVNDFDISRYSVSSTTFTWVSDVACGAIANATKLFAVFASGDIYGYNTVGTRQFKKFNSVGVLQDTFGPYDSGYNNLINWTETLYIVKSTGDDEAYRVQLETDSSTSSTSGFEEDFIGTYPVTALTQGDPYTIGLFNWVGEGGGAGTIFGNYQGSEANHPGILRLDPGGSNRSLLYIGSAPPGTFHPIPNIMEDGNKYTLIVRPVTVNDDFYCGICEDPDDNTTLDDSMQIRFDPGSGDMFFITRNTVSETTNLGAFVAGDWYNFRLVINGAAIELYNGTTGALLASHSTEVPSSVSGTPFFATSGGSTGNVFDIDYVKLELAGITR